MADGIVEGPIETRGPGVVGRWKPQWFQLDDGALNVFKLEDEQRGALVGHIALSGIVGLAHEEGKGEFSFQANGTKVRVRSTSELTTKTWFVSLSKAIGQWSEAAPESSPSKRGQPRQSDRQSIGSQRPEEEEEMLLATRASYRDDAAPSAATESVGLGLAAHAGSRNREATPGTRSQKAQRGSAGREATPGPPSVQQSPDAQEQGRRSRNSGAPAGEEEDEEEEQRLGRGSSGGRSHNGALAGDEDEEEQTLDEALAVWVQVDTIAGMPRWPEEPGLYCVTVRWLAVESGEELEERSGTPSASGDTESCTVRQQVLLPGAPGERDLLFAVFRLAPDGGDPEITWSCVISAAKQANFTAQVHGLFDAAGNPSDARVRLKLKRGGAGAPPALGAKTRQADGFAGSERQAAEEHHPADAARMSSKSSSSSRRPAPGDLTEDGPLRQGSAELPKAKPPSEQEASTARRAWEEDVRTKPSPVRRQGDPARRALEDGLQRSPNDRKFGHRSEPNFHVYDMEGTPPHDLQAASPATSSTSVPMQPSAGSPSPSNVPSRIDELHAMHKQKQLERQEKYEHKQREQLERIAQETEAVKRVGSRSHLRKEDLNPQEASRRLYMEHRDLEMKLRLRQEIKEREETERLEVSRKAARPARATSPTGCVGAREVGPRLYALQAGISEAKKKRIEDAAAEEKKKFPKVGANRSMSAQEIGNRHQQLYEESKTRQAKVEKMRKEKEDREVKELEEAAPSRAANPARIDELFKEHGERQERAKNSMAKEAERELAKAHQVCACGHMFSHAEAIRCHVCGAKRLPPEGPAAGGDGEKVPKSRKPPDPEELAARHTEALKRKVQHTSQLKEQEKQSILLACACGKRFEANFSGRCKWCGAKRAEASASSTREHKEFEHRSPADAASQHVVTTISAALALRCGCSKDEIPSAGLRAICEPLKDVLAIYRAAREESEKGGEGLVFLRTRRPSARLFMDGLLMDDAEAWQQQCEPDPIRQLDEDFDTLMENAKAAHHLLMNMVGPKSQNGNKDSICRTWYVGEKMQAPKAAKSALFAYNPGPKSRAAAQVKAFVRYGPGEGANRFRHLLDLARLSLVFADCAALRNGLEQVQEEFEVVDIRNHYVQTGSLLGERFIEVLVIVKEGLPTPHVCELRLEERVFFEAREETSAAIGKLCRCLAAMYDTRGVHPGSVEYLARKVLRSSPDSHGIRLLRRHLERVYGSSIIAWRRAFGGASLVPFSKFREACQQLSTTSYQARTVEYWQALDAGRGGCISLFELDPEGVVLLAKLRERMLALMPSDNSIDVDMLFSALSENIGNKNAGQLENLEFRKCVKALGFHRVDADRMFSYLDVQGGSVKGQCRGPAAITPKDILWLLRLPSLVHLDSVMLISANAPEELAKFRGKWAQIAEVEEERNQRLRVRQMGRRDPRRPLSPARSPLASPPVSPARSPSRSPARSPQGSPEGSPLGSPRGEMGSPRGRLQPLQSLQSLKAPSSPRGGKQAPSPETALLEPSFEQAQPLSPPPPAAAQGAARGASRQRLSSPAAESPRQRLQSPAAEKVSRGKGPSQASRGTAAPPAPILGTGQEDGPPVVKTRSALRSHDEGEEDAGRRSRTVSFQEAEAKVEAESDDDSAASPRTGAPSASAASATGDEAWQDPTAPRVSVEELPHLHGGSPGAASAQQDKKLDGNSQLVEVAGPHSPPGQAEEESEDEEEESEEEESEEDEDSDEEEEEDEDEAETDDETF